MTKYEKKNWCLFILLHSRWTRTGEIKNTTSSILTRYYNVRLYHVCIFRHTHTYKALQDVSSVSQIHVKRPPLTLLIALVKNHRKRCFIFPPKLSMKSALLRFRILWIFYLTVSQFVNNCPKTNQRGCCGACSPPAQPQDTKLTNHTFVLQNNKEINRK